MAKQILIKYNIAEIFSCMEENILLPPELEEYCSHKFKRDRTILTDLKRPMDEITRSYFQGNNPNDIALKNVIRDNLNKINNNNYATILGELKTLNYSSGNHFMLLISELILKSMNDILASKGIDNKDNKTPSEIYMSVASEFVGFCIKNDKNDTSIHFKNILTKECQRYFKDFTNKNTSMDRNNPHRVSNYKGFMNMIGILYTLKIFPKDIIKKCFDKLSKLILESDLSQDECDNYYNGYERLLNRVLHYFDNNVNSNTVEEFKIVKSYIDIFNNKISTACNVDDKNNRPIRMFSIIVHKQNIKRLNSICDKYAQL
jgi:hypothetical protein